MAAKKKTAKPTVAKPFEEQLWEAANKLRGSVESAEYKHIVLSLIFLKFISDTFEQRRAEMLADGEEDFIDMVEFYTMKNVFYLPEEARWSTIQQHAKQDDIAVKIDTAMATIEKNNASLKGALPDNYFSRLGLDASKLAALIDTINNISTLTPSPSPSGRGESKSPLPLGEDLGEGAPLGSVAEGKATIAAEEDLVGRVYEYFLGKFAATEGKGGGEFYTPKCVVNLLAEMIEPFEGKVYDPCCGSGGMFVQSIKFVENHNGNKKDISIYGQEYTSATYKLAKMNLAIRGIAANFGDVAADTFFKDQHPDLKADYIMANPPFNQSKWRGEDELTQDARWAGYEVPPTGNANYGWIMHMISKLSVNGVAGFVMANGSMSTSTKGEGAIRQKILENDLVDCMVALPNQLFYTTQIPVCLWFLTKNKKADSKKGFRDRQGETLFIDARNIGSMISRTQKEFTAEDIQHVADTYHRWRALTPSPHPRPLSQRERGAIESPLPLGEGLGEGIGNNYQDQPGYCKSATLADIAKNGYVLTPGRYVGAAPIEDDGIPFETKMTELSAKLYEQMAESQTLDAVIRKNLEVLGYGK